MPRLASGKLDVRGAVVRDYHTGGFTLPSFSGELPEAPSLFVEHPWYSEFFGNVFTKSPPKLWVFKMYLVKVHKQGEVDPIMDLSQVWVLDSTSRTVAKCPVRWLAPLDTRPADLTLRIKR